MLIHDESDCILVYCLVMILENDCPKKNRFRSCSEESELIHRDMIVSSEAIYHFYYIAMIRWCLCGVYWCLTMSSGSSQYINCARPQRPA